MTEQARKAQRAYNRDYYAKNKDKIMKTRAAYWERRGEELKARQKPEKGVEAR